MEIRVHRETSNEDVSFIRIDSIALVVGGLKFYLAQTGDRLSSTGASWERDENCLIQWLHKRTMAYSMANTSE